MALDNGGGAYPGMILGIVVASLLLAPPLARADDSSPKTQIGAWRFANGAEFPGAQGALETDKRGVLHLRYDFTRGGAYVAAYCDLAKPAALRRVSLRVRKPATDAMLTARIADSADQSFQKAIDTAPNRDFQPVTFDLQDWSGHWGGPNDGILRPPIKTLGILIENQDVDPARGELLIADVSVEEGPMSLSENASAAPIQGEYVAANFGNDSGFSCGPHAALRDAQWTADFSATPAVTLSHSLSLFGKPRTITLKVRGGARGNVLKIALGSHFQSFERVMGVLDGTEQTFMAPPPPEGWTHSGAEENNITYPLRVTTITWERGDGPAAPTTLTLAGLWCATTVPRNNAVTLLSGVRETGIDAGKRKLSAKCLAWNLLDKPVAGTLTMTVRDWEDNALATRTESWSLPANGVRTDTTWEAAIPEGLNFADAEFQFQAEGVPAIATRAGYTKPLDDPGDPSLRPESPWGMGVYLYRYGDNPDGHAEMDRAAALAQAAGVKWSREEFSWARTEPKRGAYDFHFYDTVVDTALRHGISVYGLLSYWSEWTKAYTEEGVDDFARWAAAVVHHFKDRVKHWEIYNEPNIFFWTGPKELYPTLVKKCYAAIKQEDPKAEVLAVSTAGIDRKFIKMVVDAGAPFDVLTVHPYRPRLVEPGFMRELKAASELVGDRPVWITEMGWSTHIGGAHERAQAQLLARCYLAAVASGSCANIGWYDFRNAGYDPFDFESNFGVLHADFTPKPAYRALATVCRSLAGGKTHVPKKLKDGVYGLQMGSALAVWTSDRTAEVLVTSGKAPLRAVNLMGDPAPVEVDGKRVKVRLRPGCPVFMSGAKLTKVLD